MSKQKVHYDSGILRSTITNVYRVTLCGRWILNKDKSRLTKNHPDITCKQCAKKWSAIAQRKN